MHQKFLFALLASFCILRSATADIGIFYANIDIGTPDHAGAVLYDATKGAYQVFGGGSNMWFNSDAFHFVWKKVSGDFTLAADISFVGNEGDAHRKACLIVRQSLTADSKYADVAVHGNGLTSLQYRETNGATTREISANIKAPARVRLEKHGQTISVSVAAPGETLHPSGAQLQFPLEGTFYVGLAVCSHDNKALRQAQFSNVEFKEEKAAAESPK